MDREALAQRAGVRVEDVDDVIGLAGRLQEDERAARGASVDEVKAVASELDIDPRFVEAAIQRLKDDRARAESDRVAAAESDKAAGAARKRIAAIVAVVFAVVVGISGISAAGMVTTSAHRVHDQQVETTRTSGDLAVVLDRQLALVPQLIALAGGDVGKVEEARKLAMDATTLDERLRRSLDLEAAIGEAVGALPPSDDPDTIQQRKDLRYELVGSRNRIDTERRRWEEARGAWETVAQTPGGRMAVGLGLAEPPPER
jgi:LemA protein